MRNSWTTAFVDGHVHIHPSFDAGGVLDAAATNFARQVQATGLSDFEGVLGVLMLAEADSVDRYGELRARASAGSPDPTLDDWHLTETGGRSPGLLARREGTPDLLLVPGRQVCSHERLEVLFLNTRDTYTDDRPLQSILDSAQPGHVIVVLAWGVGKWLGRRGRIVDQVIRSQAGDHEILLGDNGGRPVCWTEPSQFNAGREAGMKVLRGSDPLDLPDEEERVGSFGSFIETVIPRSDPVATIADAIRDPQRPLGNFGHLQRNARFLRNQFGLRRRRQVSEPQP